MSAAGAACQNFPRMRSSVALRSVDSLAWQPAGVPGIDIKPLNVDPATGARTSLLRSAVRTTVEHKAQYHPGDEEFLCLDGRFTFDGLQWFVPGSYVHFPPRTVHGASVQVPGGYLLYLRTTGTAVAHAVSVPRHTTPYALDAPDAGSPATVSRVTAGPAEAGGSEALRREPGGAGKVLWSTLRAGESLPDAVAAHDGPLEMLLVSGALRASGGRVVQGPAYGFYPQGLREEPLVADADSAILTHSGALA